MEVNRISQVVLIVIAAISLLAFLRIRLLNILGNDILSSIIGIMGIIIALSIHIVRRKLESWTLCILLGGIYLGFMLNDFLSAEFIANPSVIGMILELLGAVLLLSSYMFIPDRSADKLDYLFIGISFISVISAFASFIQVMIAWLPWSDVSGVNIGYVRYNLSIIVNILKSLFLSAFFLFLDRALRLWRANPQNKMSNK